MANECTVIVPVYNEEKSIASFHARLSQALADGGVPYTILYINDGSTDSSAVLLKQTGAAVVTHDFNRGYGAAIKTGLRYAKTDFIAIIDCDGTYSPDDLPRLYTGALGCDMVVGARPMQRGINPLSKKILTAIATYAVDCPIPDLNSGLRVFRREMAMQFFSMFPNGFSFTSTITLAALYTPMLVRFMPISYRKRTGKSKIRPVSAFFGFTMLIFRTMILFNPLKFFLPPAGLFAAIGAAFLVRDIIAHDIAQSSVLMLVNAFILLAIGLLAEAIRHRQ
jgi:glycosyltransferase involved in cell wall biosynthesis